MYLQLASSLLGCCLALVPNSLFRKLGAQPGRGGGKIAPSPTSHNPSPPCLPPPRKRRWLMRGILGPNSPYAQNNTVPIQLHHGTNIVLHHIECAQQCAPNLLNFQITCAVFGPSRLNDLFTHTSYLYLPSHGHLPVELYEASSHTEPYVISCSHTCIVGPHVTESLSQSYSIFYGIPFQAEAEGNHTKRNRSPIPTAIATGIPGAHACGSSSFSAFVMLQTQFGCRLLCSYDYVIICNITSL